MPGEGPSNAAVQQQLARMLSSPMFQAAPSLSRFLAFVINEWCEGRSEALKEYMIGADVLQRGADFDPRVDPIVRVQARKLRDRLREYYDGPGSNDPIGFDLPKGGYAPVVLWRRPAAEAPAAEPVEHMVEAAVPAHQAPVVRPRLSWTLITVAVAVVGAAGFLLIRSFTAPVNNLSLTQITFDNGSSHPAVSADGRWLAYESDRARNGGSDIWVQPFKGGPAARLTHHEGADTTPDISPDGTRVAFRSFRDGGGIYVVPLLGGEERRVGPGGYSPRFSPDGNWIAYSSAGGLYAVAPSGGEPRLLARGVSGTAGPLWARDGKHIVFLAHGSDGQFDWFVAPFGTGEVPLAHKMGVAGTIARSGAGGMGETTFPSDWVEGGIATHLNGSIWRIPISNWKSSGNPRQILPGPGVGFARALTTPGEKPRLLFATRTDNVHIWEQPIDPSTGLANGVMQQITRDVSLKGGFDGTRPAITPDGTRLVYGSGVSGNLDLWFKNLVNGEERALTSDSRPEERPVLSANGEHIAYRVQNGGRSGISMLDWKSGEKRLCDDCGEPKSLSRDGSLLLYTPAGARKELHWFNTVTGAKGPVVQDPVISVMEAALSPDGEWLALTFLQEGKTRVQAALAPFSGTRIAPRSSWTVLFEEMWFASIHWSPGGDRIYYFSTRDDSRCIWTQAIRNGRPLGEPVAVRHFHAARHHPDNGGWLAVGNGRLMVTLSEIVSNVWVAASP
ncbi:MAG: PD40 domain-containing protein [Acidobacteria bacterium]|nr:PD40 domain-containing protein [Acidobacteriota bacterium]